MFSCQYTDFFKFPDSRKTYVLKRKVVKIRFLRLFASIHRPSLNQGRVFSLRNCQIRIPRIFLPLEVSFLENSRKFFHVGDPLLCCVSSSQNFIRQLHMQLSRQRERFRIYCKSKKCFIFHELSEYIKNDNFFS
jgi:hypothetical protein